MNDIEQIKKLLIELRNNRRMIIELEKYNISDIISVALDNELYESLKLIFQPITIDGVVKIYFDAFSTDILNRIMSAYDSKELAEEDAKNEYELIQKQNEELSEESRKLYEDKRTYDEILLSKKVISKEIKNDLIESLFSIDFDLINQIKVKDSHARQISGVGHPVKNINDIIFYSEPACLEACIELFNKNIRTTMNDTEGVIEDGSDISEGVCQVQCDYESLSLENKKIADNLIACGQAKRYMHGDEDTLEIFVLCSPDDTIGEVSNRLKSIAYEFLPQDILYGRSTPMEMYEKYEGAIKRYSFASRDCFKDGFSVEGLLKFTRKFGICMFYDEEEDLVWECPEYFQKHKAYLEEMSEKNSDKKI